MKERTRGIATIADLRRRGTIDPLDRNPYDPCWHWTGAKATDGTPRIWAFDPDCGEKKSLSGPRAVWLIKTGKGTAGMLAYRNCWCTDCVNPGHIELALSKRAIGRAQALAGNRKGNHVEAKRASLALGRAAQGLVDTPEHIKAAVREAGYGITGRALAAQLGISEQQVCKIRARAGGRQALGLRVSGLG